MIYFGWNPLHGWLAYFVCLPVRPGCLDDNIQESFQPSTSFILVSTLEPIVMTRDVTTTPTGMTTMNGGVPGDVTGEFFIHENLDLQTEIEVNQRLTISSNFMWWRGDFAGGEILPHSPGARVSIYCHSDDEDPHQVIDRLFTMTIFPSLFPESSASTKQQENGLTSKVSISSLRFSASGSSRDGRLCSSDKRLLHFKFSNEYLDYW